MNVTTAAARFPFLEHPRPIALAHRGGAEEAPENTMAAFENARRLGLRYVETDVQLSRDGALLTFHDDRLDRVTDRRGAIADLPWSELRGARVHGREAIPHLEEALDAFPEQRFVIELKTDRTVEPLTEAIRRTGAIDRVCVGSFSDARIRRARKILGPRLCTSLGRLGVLRLRLASLGLPCGGFVEAAAQVPVRHHGLPVVDKRMLATARARGIQIQVWTVNREAEMEHLLDLGVDGIMTDRPSLLKAVLKRRGLWAD
jgi:glycerophosphoryl diester phosphodiesterase